MTHSSETDSLDASRDLANQQLRAGEPLLAYNTATEALEKWPADLRLRQLQGLALARSGAISRAVEVLQALRDEGHEDGETLGLLARTHKDHALLATDANERRAHLDTAFAIYEGAYEEAARQGRIDDAYYTGINAATLALLINNEGRAGEIAKHVEELCQGQLESGAGGEYWLLATLGEAALIRRKWREAETLYRRAAEHAVGRFADLSSTRKQARLLLEYFEEPADWLEQALMVPPVLAVTGHMIDQPGRFKPRFPAEDEAMVQKQIEAVLDRVAPVAVYGQAACGTDILCLEAQLERGGEIHIVLPFPPDEFRRTSVDIIPDADWGERFERVIEAAQSVTATSDHYAEGSASTYHYANLILTGMAQLRAQVLQTSLSGLAVWDGKDAAGPGGTGDVVSLWRARGFSLDIVELASADDEGPAVAVENDEQGFRHELKAMLFADAVGYSKMTENQIPIFISKFLGAIADLNSRTLYHPIHMETAGDGLYFVFNTTAEAGRYGLELSELVRSSNWEAVGLPGTLDMRVGLHAGPVFSCIDPITKTQMYTGPHTSRTARIEPITPPGQVYASSAFAAVAAANGVKDLVFDYVGRTNLAKKYGALTLYHVR